MTELIYNNTNSLLEEMYRQQDNPPSGDPVIAAMSEALPLAMEELPRFDGTVTRYIKKLSLQNSEEASSGVPVSEAYGKLRAALQYMATMYEREVVHQHPFPHGYHRPQRWRYLFERIDQDPAAQSLTETILNHLPVNTTTKDR
ncbi:MAG TPA: hypothetical protein VLF43_02955, partial [Candidatus Saccharimonadales bacterium]|nr:hypothetical protein [Candidatus Saccharimonadales bacterium]